MTKKPDITRAQLLCMAVLSSLVFPYTFLPILNSPPANQDVWIALLMSFVYILAINAPLLFLMNRFRGMNINEIVDTIVGGIAGKIVIIPFILFFIYCFTACLLITSLFINIYLFPGTPLWALLLFMAVPMCYTSYKGAGTIGRLATFIIPLILSTIVVFTLISLRYIDLNVFRPVLAESTFVQLNLGAFLTAARYSEILIFFVFSYFLKQKDSINKTYGGALAVFGISFFLILTTTMGVLGVDFAKLSWNPYYVFTRQMDLFGFIERMQSLNTLAWFPASLLKLTLYNYMASYVLSGVFRTGSHKYFVVPIAVAGFAVCLLPVMNKSSTVEFLRSDRVFPYIILPVIFIIPLLLIIVYLLRKSKIDPLIDKAKKAAERADAQLEEAQGGSPND